MNGRHFSTSLLFSTVFGPVFANLLLALLYALLAKVVLMYFSDTGSVTLIWLPGGLGLAALMLWGFSLWPGVLLGALAAGLLVGHAGWLALMIALGNTLESVLACRWLQGNPRFSLHLNIPQHFLQLLCGGGLFALLSTVIGPLAILAAGLIEFHVLPEVMLHWWMADFFGIATLTPVILIWRHWPTDWFENHLRRLESLLLLAVTIALAYMIFIQSPSLFGGKIAKGYWMFAVMGWAAMRFACHGVSLVASLTSLLALFGAAQHQGLFGMDFAETGLMNFWFYLLILSWTGIFLGLTFKRNQQITEGLSASESRLRGILDASPVPFALCHDQHGISSLNPAFLRSFGYSLADIPTLDDWWNKAYPDADYRHSIQKQWQQELARCRYSGEIFRAIESQIVCGNGEIRSVLLSSALLLDRVDSQYLLVFYDVTDKLAANKALAESVSMLRATLDATADGIIVIDLQGEIGAYNQQFLRLWGLSESQMRQADGNFVLTTLMERVSEPGLIVRRLRDLEIDPAAETLDLLNLLNGMCFECYSRAQRVDQVIVGRAWSFRDITVRERVEEQLLWRTTFLEALIESAPDGIIAVDSAGRKLLQNHLVAELWRIPPEVSGNPDDKVQVEFVKNQTQDPEAFAAEVAHIYTHPLQVVDDELELKHGVILKRFSKAVYDKQRKYYGRIWHFSDITEKRRTERELIEKEYYQRALLDNFPFSVWLKDRDSRYLAVNRTFASQLGLDSDDVPGKTDFDFFSQQLAMRNLADDKQVIEQRCQINFEEQVVIAENSRPIWMETYKAPLLDDQGAVLGSVGFARDISHRKEVEEQLHLAALVYHNSSEAMVVTDADNRVLTVNPAFNSITGYCPDEVVGRPFAVMHSGNDGDEIRRTMWHQIDLTGNWHGELGATRKNGEAFVLELRINSYFDGSGNVQRRVALFSDITLRKQSEEQVWRQANYDPLTELPNRRMFCDRLTLEIKKAERMEQSLGLLFIDLDRFKDVNDTLGHEMGDLLLKDAARRLTQCVRESDTVARLSGDEFTIILGEIEHVDSLERVAQDVLLKLGESFQLGEERVFISASIGIALYPDDGDNLRQLLKNADQAMYEAKNHGRNNYRFFTAAMQEALSNRATMLAELRNAIAESQFALCYQPIVELATGEVCKAEALLRWQHPQRGTLTPEQFIGLAQEADLIGAIDDWVFESAIKQVGEWRQSLHPQFQLGINQASLQFTKQSNALDRGDYVRSSGLSGQVVWLEIAESELRQVGSFDLEQLHALREQGIELAINDFGSSYLALSCLKKIAINYFKIAPEKVAQLQTDVDELALCEAIVAMAHTLGQKVIAVGVESPHQAQLLASIGCDYAQGNWLAPPLSAVAFARQFADWNADGRAVF